MTASAGTVSGKCWRFVFREARMADIIVLDDVSDAGVLIKRILERQEVEIGRASCRERV